MTDADASKLANALHDIEQDPLFDEFCEWRSFENDPETETPALASLDRRASFEDWLRARKI